MLIIAGSAQDRAPFESTRLTIKIDALPLTIATLTAAGTVQLEAMQRTPVGHKTRFRHPDGLVVEYVDHTT